MRSVRNGTGCVRHVLFVEVVNVLVERAVMTSPEAA
jgi:hypothetical protein